MSSFSKKIKKFLGGGLFGGGLDSLFPGVGTVAEKGIEAMMPKLPEIPAAPVSPDNDPVAQAKIAEAAQREREREAKRKGRASTILAGELDDDTLNVARRSLGGGNSLLGA